MLSTWALLMIAVVTEIAWGCSLKALSYYSLDRIFALVPIALTCANMYLLARVMKTLPSGLTYAVWTTLGAAGVLIAGAFLFNESLNKGQIFFISPAYCKYSDKRIESGSQRLPEIVLRV